MVVLVELLTHNVINKLSTVITYNGLEVRIAAIRAELLGFFRLFMLLFID
jgi:hypothetical protein